MPPDEEERLQKVERLNKVSADLQTDSLEERLYLGLNRWKKTAGYIVIVWFAYFLFVITSTYFPSSEIQSQAIGLAFIVVMFASFFGWESTRRRSRSIQNEYERRQYSLVLLTMEGEGETVLEKFMDIAIRVFPPLKQVARKHGFSKDWWLEETKKRGEVKYDISVSVSSALRKTWFLVKRFDKTVTFDDIKDLYMTDPAERKKSNILRIVAIAKDYDQSFFTDDFEEQMNELLFRSTGTDGIAKKTWKMRGDSKYKQIRKERIKYNGTELDLLIEHENGFTPLWLS